MVEGGCSSPPRTDSRRTRWGRLSKVSPGVAIVFAQSLKPTQALLQEAEPGARLRRYRRGAGRRAGRYRGRAGRVCGGHPAAEGTERVRKPVT